MQSPRGVVVLKIYFKICHKITRDQLLKIVISKKLPCDFIAVSRKYGLKGHFLQALHVTLYESVST